MSDPLRIRLMRNRDITAGMRLKGFAGWNQVPADWQTLMALDPKGCFVGEVNNEVVATTTAVSYGRRLGWIGMVLVDPAFRRRGIATRMMEHGIAYLESIGCRCQKLDATEDGARVYAKMGFTVEYQVERWRGKPAALATSPDLSSTRGLSLPELNWIGSWDAEAFGVSRKILLERYCREGYPGFWAGSSASPRGFILGRPGSAAFHVGPLVAIDPKTAEALLTQMLSQVEGTGLIADISAANQDGGTMLRSFGFEPFRILHRMYRGSNDSPGMPERVFCLAGFEFG